MNTYKVVTIGTLNGKIIQYATKINETEIDKKNKINRFKEKYPDFLESKE